MSFTINYHKILISFFISILFFSIFYFFVDVRIKNKLKIQLLENNLNTLTSNYVALQKDFSYTKSSYKNTIAILESESQNWKLKYQDKKEYLDKIEDQIQDAFGKVETISKIQKTDRELLAKYSKEYFLNEHYIPSSLSSIKKSDLYNTSKNLEFHTDVLKYLENMITKAKEDEVILKIISAYRSFEYQKNLKHRYVEIYGQTNADAFSANEGLSEHQLGTVIDFVNPKTGKLKGFENTKEYKWLSDNAYKYGFILSYDHDNTYYSFEPWHWRFVGIKLAKKIHKDNTAFYKLDQREIYDYLEYFFD